MTKLKELFQLALVAMGIAAFATNAQAKPAPDYTLYLTNGVAYTDEACTTPAQGLGDSLTYADGVWTMNDFTFETTAPNAVVIKDPVATIDVTGTNSITVGADIEDDSTFALKAGLLTITGSGTLTAKAAKINSKEAKRDSAGISVKSLIVRGNVSVKAAGGDAVDNCSSGIKTDGALLVMDNAVVEATACQGDEWSEGVSTGLFVVLGNGKVTASSSSTTEARGVVAEEGEPAAVAKDESGNVLTFDTKNRTYFAYGSTSEYATNTILTVGGVANYTIYLSGGKAYIDEEFSMEITPAVAGMGLTYADGVWTMNSFNFKTRATYGVEFHDPTTIKLVGENSITVGTTNEVDTISVVGLNLPGFDKEEEEEKEEEEKDPGTVVFTGDGSLVVTAELPSSGGATDSTSRGISGYAKMMFMGGARVTAVAQSGNPGGEPSKCVGLQTLSYLIVSNATVNATADNGIGVAVGPVEGTAVSEDGELTAKGGLCGFLSPNSTAPTCSVAKDGDTGEDLIYVQCGDRYTYSNSCDICKNVALGKLMPTEPIEAKPTVVENADAVVYTNNVKSAEVEGKPGFWYAWSNRTATVVYTTKSGYYFADGTTNKTVSLDTSVNPAVNKGEVPVAGKPTLKLGTVAQRYPWNGIVDVNYKTERWLPGLFGAVEITANDQTYTNNLDIFSTGKSKTGVPSHAVDLKWLFGEMQGEAKFKALVSDKPIGFAAVKKLAAGEFPAEYADKACTFRSMDTVTNTVESQVSPYAEWKVDFVLCADKDIEKGTIYLAGLVAGEWISIPMPGKLEAGKEVAVITDWLKSIPPYSENPGLPQSWHYSSKTVKEFTCGVKNGVPANNDKKLKVTLRLTDKLDKTKTLDIATVETTLVAPAPKN